MEISEIENKTIPSQTPILEVMNINVPKIVAQNISQRNGMIYCLCGSGGSGKSSLLLNFFKHKHLYRQKFNNIWYICPDSSFTSVLNHPFKDHDKVIHEVTTSLLYELYNELEEIKLNNIKNKKKIEYSLIIFDDYADIFKDNTIIKALNKLLIKARHLCCGFIFTLQSYYYFPKILRKQITYLTIFKCKNIEEWYSISKEVLNMKSDNALQLYNYIFDESYNHLDIDTVKTIYYKNFNELIIKN